MNKKALVCLPALIVTLGITLSQVGVWGVVAQTPISSPISAPIINPTPSPDVTSNNSGNSSDSTSPAGAPSCNDSKPTSAPVLLSATSKKPNQVTLTWVRANNPVTYYLISYGTNIMANQYGNPNVGNVTSYTVSGLSGNTTYFFRVRAGNGCTPGDFSNVLSVKANGKSISQPALGFKPGILSASTSSAGLLPSPTPIANTNSSNTQTNLLQRLANFFAHIFGH